MLSDTFALSKNDKFSENAENTESQVKVDDFPPSFRTQENMFAHPKDYHADTEAIEPYIFLYRGESCRRLFLRISLKISESDYTTATFLLDSTTCEHVVLSPRLYELLKHRIFMSELGPDYLVTNGTPNGINVKCAVTRGQVNVLGLPMFFLMGIQFMQARTYELTFDEDRIAYDVATQILTHI